MIEGIFQFMDKLAPLKSRKSPQLAALLGFVLGGIGLGIYFLSFIDFLIPIGLAILLTLIAQGFGGLGVYGTLAGAILASLWGYCRALNSNQRLQGERTPQE